MKEYTIGVAEWWYGIKVKEILNFVIFRITFLLVLTKTLPMIKSYTKPLYGDNSKMGRVIGVFIRTWWIILGSFTVAVLSIPYIALLIFAIVLPLLPIVFIL